MSWTGKIIGGALGTLLGGPLGAAIGIGIGHQFDKNGPTKRQTANAAMHAAFFGCLAKMARADGQVTAEEIRVVESMFSRLNYTPQMRKAAIDTFRQAKDDPYTAADYLNQLATVIGYNHEMALSFMAALHAIAAADGQIHPGERNILLQAERIFRLPPGTADSMLGGAGGGQPQRRQADLDEAYAVLECRPDMDDHQIKRAYREKVNKFHPDKLASQGLPDEFMQYAHEQMVKVQNAYDLIKKARKI